MITTTPNHQREALAAILAVHPGNTCEVQCARIRAALSQFSLTTFEASRYLDTIAAITRAIGQMQKAITGSKAVWLPGTEEAQERLPCARHDLSFQGFLKTLADSTEQGAGTTDNAQGALR